MHGDAEFTIPRQIPQQQAEVDHDRGHRLVGPPQIQVQQLQRLHVVYRPASKGKQRAGYWGVENSIGFQCMKNVAIEIECSNDASQDQKRRYIDEFLPEISMLTSVIHVSIILHMRFWLTKSSAVLFLLHTSPSFSQTTTVHPGITYRRQDVYIAEIHLVHTRQASRHITCTTYSSMAYSVHCPGPGLSQSVFSRRHSCSSRRPSSVTADAPRMSSSSRMCRFREVRVHTASRNAGTLCRGEYTVSR